MRLHIQRNQEPKHERPRYFEATFRLELDAEEESLAAHYGSDGVVVCGLTGSMVSGPDMEELMKAKGVTLGLLRKGVTLRSWINNLLEDEEAVIGGCRNLLGFLKSAAAYQGAVTIDI